MNISPKERFLDIAHFKRPGDLMLGLGVDNYFEEQTIEEWVKQGAPKEIIQHRFRREYFQLPRVRVLFPSGQSAMESQEALPSMIDIGHGFTVKPLHGLNVPAYEPRFISENERTVTFINVKGQTVRRLKESLKTDWGMSMYLDWPVKDRASWNEYKKRLDPNTPERWPSDWNAYVQTVNGISEPLSLGGCSFYGYLRDWVGSERILYMFYDDPGLIEDMMEQIIDKRREAKGFIIGNNCTTYG